MGEFTLARFGPTEFKTLLVGFGLVLGTTCLLTAQTVALPFSAAQLALAGYATLIVAGLIQLPINLIRAVKEVNRSAQTPDQSEWITTRSP